MKMTREFFLVFVITVTVILNLTPAEGATAPTEAVKATVNAVIDTVKDKGLSQPGKRQERRVKISALINDRFDFGEMAQRSLARHWGERTPEEKKEFVKVFSELIKNSYIGKIESYTDEKITYNKEAFKGDGKYSVVGTTIITKSVEIPIEYKLILRGDEWLVYDVTIEGVSFVSTYREQYNKTIMKESYAGLLKKMKGKLQEIKTLEEKEASVKN